MPPKKSAIPNRKELKKRYDAKHPIYEEILNNLQEELTRELVHIGLHPTIKTRVKSFDNYYDKLLRLLRKHKSQKDAFFIYDVMGLRIVCPFLDDLRIVENLIKNKFYVVELERKGEQHSFKEFGYESIHFLVKVPPEIMSRFPGEESLVCEIQLRTILQDAWSEVEHELVYKADFSPFDTPLKRKLAALNANLTLSDTLFQEIRDYQHHLQTELKKRKKNFFDKIHNTGDGIISGIPPDNGLAESEVKNEIKTADVSASFYVDKSIDDLLMEALDAHNTGQFKKAIAIYSSILNIDIQEYIKSIIYIHRGMAYFVEPDYKKALEDFTRAVELNQENYKAFYYRGLTFQILQNYHRALEDFNQCLHLNPYQSETHYSRAQVYFHLGDYPKALSDCEQSLNIEPEAFQVQKFRELVRSYIHL
jgi:putative GTP pyrophosphokinase